MLRELPVGFALREARLRLFGRRVGLLDRRFRLMNLLIQFRRLDLGEHLAGSHAIPDIGETTLEIAVRPREDRRFGQGLHRARQLQHVLVRPALHAHHGQTRQAFLLRVGLGPERRFAALHRHISSEEPDHEQDQQSEQQRGHGRTRRLPERRRGSGAHFSIRA